MVDFKMMVVQRFLKKEVEKYLQTKTTFNGSKADLICLEEHMVDFIKNKMRISVPFKLTAHASIETKNVYCVIEKSDV